MMDGVCQFDLHGLTDLSSTPAPYDTTTVCFHLDELDGRYFSSVEVVTRASSLPDLMSVTKTCSPEMSYLPIVIA